MTRRTKSSEPEVGFTEAMEQLETILLRIEDEEIDIDELAAELKRATTLLEVCRGKLRRAEVEVSQIVQQLDDPESDDEEDD